MTVPPAEALIVLADVQPQLETLTVLVGDGNPHSRRLTRTLLINVGIRAIHESVDGPAVIDAIPELNPDVMIIEWDMPGLNGCDVMGIVRSPGIFPKPNLPVIMLSDSGQRTRLDRAMRAGVNEFLVKPISPKILRQRLTSIILNPRPMVHSEGRYVPLPRRVEAAPH